jgi:MFS family permease
MLPQRRLTPGQLGHPNAVLAAVCVALVFVPLTITGSGVILPDVSHTLHSGLTSTQWVVNSFLVTFASFMAITGSLADLTGRRRMFAIGLVVFLAATVTAAVSTDIAVLLFARVVGGVGAAAVTTGGTSLLAATFVGPGRGRAFSIFGTALGLGLAFGPMVAGISVTVFGGWRAFFVAIAVALVPVTVVSFRLPEHRDPHPAGPDWAGAVLFTSALSLLVIGVSEGPVLGWTHPVVAGSLAVTAVLIVVFASVERGKEYPLVDIRLFANRRFLAICLTPVLLGFGFIGLLFYLPQYFVGVGGRSALDAGLLLMLLTGPSLVIPVVVGLVRHLVSVRVLLVVTLAFLVVGPLWLTVLEPGAGVARLAGPLLLTGASFGTSLAFLDGAAVDAVEPARAGMAAGVFNTMRLGGEAVTVAVLGALVTATTHDRLTGTFDEATAERLTAKLVQGDLAGAVAVDPAAGNTIRTVGAAAFTAALHVGLFTIVAVSLLGTVGVALLVRRGDRPATARTPVEPVGAHR